jgi:hypothetical protein
MDSGVSGKPKVQNRPRAAQIVDADVTLLAKQKQALGNEGF